MNLPREHGRNLMRLADQEAEAFSARFLELFAPLIHYHEIRSAWLVSLRMRCAFAGEVAAGRA